LCLWPKKTPTVKRSLNKKKREKKREDRKRTKDLLLKKGHKEKRGYTDLNDENISLGKSQSWGKRKKKTLMNHVPRFLSLLLN